MMYMPAIMRAGTFEPDREVPSGLRSLHVGLGRLPSRLIVRPRCRPVIPSRLILRLHRSFVVPSRDGMYLGRGYYTGVVSTVMVTQAPS